MKVEIKLLDERLTAPEYAKPGDAAVDLRACRINGVTLDGAGRCVIWPKQKVKVGTGVAVYLGSMEDDGVDFTSPFYSLAGLVLPRSGLGSAGIRLSNTIGLCDSGYQGEIILAIENAGSEQFTIEPLMRLAQYMIVPVLKPSFEVVAEFSSKTERGAGGFGSSGVA